MNSFTRPFNAKERATRLEYALYGLMMIIYYYASYQYNTWLSVNIEDYHLSKTYKALHLIDFIVFYFGLTVSFRRLHDLNKSKATILWIFTVIGILPILYLLTFKKGSAEANKYGDAKGLSSLEKPIIALYIIATIAFCTSIWIEFTKTYNSMSEWQDTDYQLDNSTRILERLYSDSKRHTAFRVLLICQGKEMAFLIYPMKRNPINPKDPLIPFAINTESTEVAIYSTSENLRNKFSVSSDLEDKFVTLDFLSNLDKQKLINEDIEITFKDYASAYQVKFDMKGQNIENLIQTCK